MSNRSDLLRELLMPRLSDTMSEGVVARWLKSVGDAVVKGEPVAEVETDKVTVELEAPADGVLLAVLVPGGGTTHPGAVVAVVGPEGAVYDGDVAPPDPRGVPASRATVLLPEAPPETAAGRRSASPLARRLASEHGIDLASLDTGSGPDGRVLRQDVERVIAATRGSQPAVAGLAPDDEVVTLTQLQKTLARRMTAAKRDIPHYYVDTTVDVTRLLQLRADAKAAGLLDAPLTAYLVRAAALALRAFPRVNASWLDGSIVRRGTVNVGIAVALPDDGLVVPVVADADRKSLSEIAAESADLIERARDGRLGLDAMTGGTFTISNLGGFGITTFHAVVNPSESAILAVGAIRRVPACVGDELVARDAMQLSLSADHRVLSGATAAGFVADVSRRLEQPLGLLDMAGNVRERVSSA